MISVTQLFQWSKACTIKHWFYKGEAGKWQFESTEDLVSTRHLLAHAFGLAWLISGKHKISQVSNYHPMLNGTGAFLVHINVLYIPY